ncbi:MAG: ABC transporter permease [Clostridia bacterium]|nr:ABC transporter permease [Clostridia bacterium]
MENESRKVVFLTAQEVKTTKLYPKEKEEETLLVNEEIEEEEEIIPVEDEAPLDKTLKLMSPTRMVVRRFFRSKLSVIGLVMVIGLFLFSFVGPYIYHAIVPGLDGDGWQQDEKDESGKWEQTTSEYTYTLNGKEYTVYQTLEKYEKDNVLAKPSKLHPLGTDKSGYDVLSRLMYGGRVSLIVSFLAVFIITALGIIAGGIAGYFGGFIDNVIMRICDILMCLPGIPILLIVGVLLNGWISKGLFFISGETRIYFLMIFISCISWPGTARLVRGQILSLREQEYMVAAEAMGYSTFRKIFKHLIPNVMPQLIVQMTLGLGSMIIYESTLSYLGFGVKAPNTAWGTILNLFEEANGFEIAMANPLIWVPAGLCIVIAVLGFNFVGDGLRDALDPKSRR